MNKLDNIITGDCFEVLKNIESNSIDMIYLDPPFFTQDKQELINIDGNIYSFDDKWNSITEYLLFLEQRVIECKRILKDDGTIFLHCDKHAVHYLKIMLDDIFGYDNFINDIIWSYKRWSNSKNGLQNNHQNILYYSKNKKFKFNKIYTNYSPTTNIDQILLQRTRDDKNKSIYSDNICEEKKGVLLGDVWDIPFLNPKAKERVGYPTQKPIILLERIINISTNENDIVLDPFCGSGTTCVAAKIMNRRFIGIDTSKEAIKIANNRIENPIKTESLLLKNGITSYTMKNDKMEILDTINANVIQRNKNADGILNSNLGLIPIKIQDVNENIDDAINKLKKFASDKNLIYKILLTKYSAYSLFEESDNFMLKIDLNKISNKDLNNEINNWISKYEH